MNNCKTIKLKNKENVEIDLIKEVNNGDFIFKMLLNDQEERISS